jgi:hypothetical protein
MPYVITAFVSFLAGGAVMFFFDRKAVQAAKTAELKAKAELSLADSKVQVFKSRVAAEVDKLEQVPAHAVAALKNLIHGTAEKAGKKIEKL